ncbi:sigma 54-interacting transcriptional regulator [Dyella soli]|uniref:Sigma-54-dependent Fis family transcriptional regulator n=1 Tax=Dyella soli TaxID=522319 RepID=A0A4R0YMN8_9GAMM|nr:sigma-54 dependent transcriptional regulator [Dyella soli]TCI10147.1 sigma-54-dependent Fis family transcriptional regulator [Dyella soli]
MSAMLGQSAVLLSVREELRRFSACDVPVLIEGETGTGKELAAREIHYSSSRRDRPFVPVNCGALPDHLIENELFGHERGAYTDATSARPGLVDHARGGTLFLDEVDTLSAKAQVTLLRFLESNEFRPIGGGLARVSDARVIAATNSSLRQRVADGLFRRDLEYRLNALYVRLPPLRERAGDVPLLAAHFLDLAARRLDGLSKAWTNEATQILCAHHWPGNVRELENLALRAYMRTNEPVVDVSAITELVDIACEEVVEAFRAHSTDPMDLPYLAAKSHAMHAFEHRYLTHLMARTGGNVSSAARLSGTERRQLGKLLKKHGIDIRRFRSPP